MPDDVGYPMVETLPMASMPLSYQMYMDPEKRDRMTKLAQILAGAKGFVPKFLEENQYSCFAVVCRSITWKLDMFAVAQSCYEVGGKIAYEGKLVQAVLSASGRLAGGIKYEHYGDWSRLRGKFKMVASRSGAEHAVPNWTDKDEDGLGVTVSARLVGEDEPRTWDFDLAEAWPRNSVLWARSPKTQICYTAVRRFASLAVPELFAGVPFDHETISEYMTSMRDVTPRRPMLQEYGDNGFVGSQFSPEEVGAVAPAEAAEETEQTEGDAAGAEQEDEPEQQQQPAPAPGKPAEAPAASKPAATSSPSATGDIVPAPRGAQAWFEPAKKKLLEMLEERRPSEDFRRFRAAHQTVLRELEQDFEFWYGGVNELIRQGERGAG
jgi:hypothetical protein